MDHPIRSLHHVTATVNEAQEDLDFYTGLLGLRLVKKTVNFDNPGVYHFYYGNRHGAPGTIMTTFPYRDKGVRVGRKGAGQVIATAFSVPAGALDFWQQRLAENGVAAGAAERRFGEDVLAFEDPSGLVIELVATEADERAPWEAGGIAASVAIRGLHSVTLSIREPAPTQQLLHDVLGFDVTAEAGDRTRFGVHGGGAGHALDVLHQPAAPDALNGLGTVHHVALAIGTEDEQLMLREKLLSLDFNVTEVRDRQYFRSIYFREPGGVLLEVATAGPGFLVDEDDTELGRGLMLPPWEEPKRTAIEAGLPPVRT